MPPLVTVSAALLSTNTRSKRGRNFLNACPAMTPTAALPYSALTPPYEKTRSPAPRTRERGKKGRVARLRARPPRRRPSPREWAAAAARAAIRRERPAQATDAKPRRRKKEELFLGFSRPPTEVKGLALRPPPGNDAE